MKAFCRQRLYHNDGAQTTFAQSHAPRRQLDAFATTRTSLGDWPLRVTSMCVRIRSRRRSTWLITPTLREPVRALGKTLEIVFLPVVAGGTVNHREIASLSL